MKLLLFRKTFILCLLFAFTNSYAQIIPKWEWVHPKYETSDAFVAGFNVMDYGADPTGATDQTHLFQQLLDSLGSRAINKGTRWNNVPNGGTLYVPEGKYLFSSYLLLPKGVTIRGDWEKPVKGQPIKGTIMMFDNSIAKGHSSDSYSGGKTSYEAWSFITLQPSSAVRDLNFWYPSQDPDHIVPYPPTILLGQAGYWGNDYPTVSDVTFVNSYDGLIFSRQNGGGAPNCYDIYGTPLKRGIEIDNIAEVGRVDNVDFSPDYWAGSGLPGSPSIDGPHKKFIADSATAVTVRRIDWSFVGNVKADGYNTGYRLDIAYNDNSAPNGHFYGMDFTNCKYGVYVSASAGAGDMFYDFTFNNCDYGFYFDKASSVSPGGIVQIQGCQFNTNLASIYAPTTNDKKILISQSTVNKGPVDIRGGLASIVNCDFNNDPNQIILGQNTQATVTGNRFKQEPSIKNVSLYNCIVDNDPVEMTPLPEFPYKNQYDFTQKPSGTAFYVATDNGVSADADDNSDALQALLDQAGNEGGGLVFIPPGHYNFRKPIHIPSGVELKGSVDTPTVPMGPGTAMEIYAGKGDDESGTPFITMDPGSGIRGLVMDYPEQIVQLLTDSTLNNGDVYHYPYVIRGNKDVYIVNIGLRACYNGIDLFTNKCDNHFVNYLAGHVFKTGIRVGGGSQGGHIYNTQFNQIAYGSGYETKFGQWPNSPDNTNPDQDEYNKEYTASYAYSWNHLYFFILEDCSDQVMFNNFIFGTNRGFTLASKNGTGPQGISLGQGLDAGLNPYYIEGVGNNGFNFINSQIVTTNPNDPNSPYQFVEQTYVNNNRYIQVDPDFSQHVTFFGADFWGQPQNIAVEVPKGTIELQAGNFSNSGQKTFASVSPGAMFDIIGTNVNPVNTLLASGTAPQFYIQSSIVNSQNVDTASCGLWFNNISQTASVSDSAGGFLHRDGWIATASVYNENAMLTLDGNSSTTWSTSTERQKPGQWFIVDMRTDQTFTGIYMVNDGSTYNPISFKVSVSSDSVNWATVATGGNTNQVVFDKQTARYIKVEQTGTNATAAWRIVEFLVTDTYLPLPDDSTYNNFTALQSISPENNMYVWYANRQLHAKGTTGVLTARIYAISGQQILPEFNFETSASVNLPSGIYIVLIKNKGILYRTKILISQ